MAKMFVAQDARSMFRAANLLRLGLVSGIAWFLAPLAIGGEPPNDKDKPTFTKDVAPILQKKCQNCHRSHHIGPFALETYEQARKRASDIALVSSERQMPPWKPAPGIGPRLKHDQSLTPKEIAVLEAWAEADAPRGDPKDMPPPPQFAAEWKLGTPDLILEPADEFSMPASGPDTYRCFVIPTNLVRDAYVSAIDFRPRNLRVVHHINAFIDNSGVARAKDEAESGPGYTSFAGPGIPMYEDLSFWAAGHEPHHLPEGIAQRLPRQSDVILQVHYHPTGKPEVDRTRIGIYFSRVPVKQVLHWSTASNSEFKLPAGQSNIEVKASWNIPVGVEILAVSPHMHLLGRDMRMTVTFPSGRTQDLIHIPEWDPSWQSTYFFQKTIPVPAGSVVKVIAHYDNSDHPRNPNRPPKPVSWGFGANDEMCEGFIAVVKQNQDLTRQGATDDLPIIFAKQRLKQMRKQLTRQSR
jgi:hypothetical protein